MYLPLKVEVKSLGEDVVLSIGSYSRRMHFEAAILLAHWMSRCARAAKSWTGHTHRRLYAVGTLHDASAKDWLNAGQPNDPRHVARVNRDLLRRENILVRQNMAMVVLELDSASAEMTHQAAQTISQWIRLKAKESQMRAGDLTRHWSKVTQAHEAQHGPEQMRG
jgi:hypothetical protein